VEDLTVRLSPGKGRGVFAERDFAEGELVERAPTLLIPPEQRLPIRATVLEDYFFNWKPADGVVALSLGYAMVYNHSRSPDVAYYCRTDDGNFMDFVALRPIAAGQEVFDNYGEDAADQTPMWFEKEEVPMTARVLATAVAEELLVTAANSLGRLASALAKSRDRPAHEHPRDDPQAPDVQFSNGGRLGLLAAQSIAVGEIIEEAPVVVLSRREARMLAMTDVVPYLEDWPLEGDEVALPLGHAAMCRSGPEPNAQLVKRLDAMILEVAALKSIEEGEEIVVSRASCHTSAASAAEARLLRIEAQLRLSLRTNERYYLRRGG
jgi:hypothetical protein